MIDESFRNQIAWKYLVHTIVKNGFPEDLTGPVPIELMISIGVPADLINEFKRELRKIIHVVKSPKA